MAATLNPDDIPLPVARMAFRMSLRLPPDLTPVEAFRRILAACAPLAVAAAQPDPDAHGGNPR
jgi:hypothetical protein